MAGVAEFHTAPVRPARHQRCVVRGGSALAKEAVGAHHHLGERQIEREQTAEDCAEVCHQQRCGDSFARNVAQGEEKRCAVGRRYDFTIVSSYDSGGLVPEMGGPGLGFDIPPWQELALDLRRKLEILFVSAPLLRVEMVQTESLERVLLKPIGLDRDLTELTDTV